MNDRRPDRIVFYGVRHWCDHLVATIGSLGGDLPSMSVARGLRLRAAWSGRTVAVRVGYRPGAATWRGTLFDVVWATLTRPRSRRTYWIGTDVSRAIDPASATRSRAWTRWLAGASGCGAPWFVDELATIGLPSTSLRFPYPLDFSRPTVPWPDRFVVSAYVPSINPENYGIDVVAELVQRLPDVSFRVFGGGSIATQANVEHVGWTHDVPAELDRCVVHLRLTRHDGIAGTVREALAQSRHVVFSYQVPGVVHVAHDDVEAAFTALSDLRARFDCGILTLNETGREFARQMDPGADAHALLEWLLDPGAGVVT